MKIDKNIFSYPPYISTSWSKVSALHMKEDSLVVTLAGGNTVVIPDISGELIEKIFDAHAAYLDDNIKVKSRTLEGFGGDFPMKFGITGPNGTGAPLQHNPAQADMPNLPEEILEKIRSIAKVIGPDDPATIPKPEPHCNCMHCQISRTLNSALGITDIYAKDDEEEIDIAPEDLHFQQWEIIQKNDKLYVVTNKLDRDEQYNVFLGHPVGCTCGRSGCEHILAVLKS